MTKFPQFLLPASKGWGKVIFSVCQSTGGDGGRGYPGSLLPGPFLSSSGEGVPQSLVPSRVMGGGHPSLWSQVTSGGGVPLSGLGYPPAPGQDWGTLSPSQDWGSPPLSCEDRYASWYIGTLKKIDIVNLSLQLQYQNISRSFCPLPNKGKKKF